MRKLIRRHEIDMKSDASASSAVDGDGMMGSLQYEMINVGVKTI